MDTQKMLGITLDDAVRKASNPEDKVYMLVRVYGDTTLDELSMAEGFYVPSVPEREPVPNKETVKTHRPPKKPKMIDHGRIVALYQAGRTVKWIADDMKISEPTVVNHLKKEGIYKTAKNGDK